MISWRTGVSASVALTNTVTQKALGAWLGTSVVGTANGVAQKALGALAPAERDILVRFAHSNRARSAPLR